MPALFARGSIRSQLIALVVVVAAPLVGVVAWMTYDDYVTAKRANGMVALGMAESAGAGSAQFITDVAQGLEDVAGLLGDELTAPATCVQALQTARALLSFALQVVAFDAHGEPACTRRSLPAGGLRNPAGASWLHEVLTRDGFTIGQVERGGVTGSWVMPFLVPLHDADGDIVGVLSAAVEVERFQALLSGIADDPEALITIANRDNAVIARSAEPEAFVGTPLPTYPSPGEVVAPNHWLTEGTDFNDVARTWGRVDLPALGWHVYAGIPTARVRASALASAGRRATAVGAILILALVVGLVIQRRIAGSLAQLHRSVRAASSGGSVAIPEGSPVEVREVGAQLNRTLAARDEAQEHARDAQARFLSILENAAMGIFLSEGDARFLHVNPALAEMLGYASTEELERLGPRDLFPDEATRRRFEDAIADTSVFRSVETEWLRRDGSRATVELTGRIRTTASGERFFEVHAQDVTAQRRFEREIQQTQKMEAVGRLAGGVAHDFNNLLTVINGNLLLTLADPGLPDAFRGELTDASDAADRAAALTRKLLAFSRKDRPEPRVVNGDDLVRGIQKLLGRLIPERIDVRTHLAAGEVGTVMDPGQMEQVVMNLVLNARDAVAGTGSIEVETSVRHVLPTAVTRPGPRGWFVLAVRDSGVGMPAEVRSRIFEPFFTTKTPDQGTGLGLSTVHAIVTQGGGQVRVDSAPGKGTVIEVWLPAVDPESGAGNKRRDDDGLWARGETILVIEDEESVRETVRRILERVGYEVLVARDGREGVSVIEAGRQRVSLVVCDVVMPFLGGIEVRRLLSRIAPTLPVLLMSGYSTELPPLPLDPAEPDLFLGKPFEPVELLRRVREVLDAAQGTGPSRARSLATD